MTFPPPHTRVPLSSRDPEGRKRCSGCKEWLDESSFGQNASLPDGLANQCKGCQYSSGLWNKYRIRASEYSDLLNSQGGVCAICERINENGRALAVDHDHSCCPGSRSCGKCIRGLLCHRCNVSLGNMDDDPVRLRAAAVYLEERNA